MIISDLTARLKAKASHGHWMARCPAHDDRTPSLQISEGPDGRILLKCFAGCSIDDITNVLGIATRDLFPAHDKAQLVATYDYKDPQGNVVFQVLRYEPKTFKQRRPDGHGGWLWNLKGIRRPLYRFPDVLAAIAAHRPIYLVEGEKDADRLNALGLTATTNAGGAQKWSAAYTDALRGAHVVILPDNDEPGNKHAESIAAALIKTASSVKIVALPDLPPKGDVSDWLAAGHTRNELEQLVTKTPEWNAPDAGNVRHWPTEWQLNDRGNAQRLVAQHGNDLRYCHPSTTWLVWDGCRWAPDTTGEVMRRAKQTADSIYSEIPQGTTKDEQNTIFRHARASGGKNALKNMMELAQSEWPIPVALDQLDQHPWFLNCLNGTIDLQTGQLRPHQREDFLTKVLPITYNAHATAPRWEAFLDQIMNHDAELTDFVQRAIGYSLTGDTREQVFFVLHGRGANGKSVVLDTLLALLSDYGRRVAFETFITQPYGGSVRMNLATIAGARLITASESEENQKLAESLLKDITGGEKQEARWLYHDPFEFRPTAKIWLATNHRPQIRGSDHAIWRRVRLIPFTITIPEEQQDRTLPQKLREELPGILAWAVRGCLRWQQDGLPTPAAVRAATKAYREESDIIGPFIAERCVLDATVTALSGDLYRAYVNWCEENRERPLTQRTFGARLSERGLDSRKTTGGKRGWAGIGLLDQGGTSGGSDPHSGKTPISIPSREGTFLEQPPHAPLVPPLEVYDI